MELEKIKLNNMKQILHIEADFDKPELLKSMVEKLVMRRNESNKPFTVTPLHHKAIETSSTEAYVCGSVSINEDETAIKMPFDSSFIFTCIKGANKLYEVTWSMSLS